MTKKSKSTASSSKKTSIVKDNQKETLKTSKSRGRPKKVVPPSVEGKKRIVNPVKKKISKTPSVSKKDSAKTTRSKFSNLSVSSEAC